MANPAMAVLAVVTVLAGAAAALEAPAAARPSLFFGPGDIAALKAKCQGPMNGQYDALIKYAGEHVADAPPAELHGDNEERGLQIEHPFLTNILNFSFAYVVTKEFRYLAAAKRWTLALARMDEWEGKVVESAPEADRGLYTGFGLTALAAAYDWLYAEFTPAERTVIRAKIAARCEAIYRATTDGEWWSEGYLHHDLWIPAAGMGVGAIAIIDEEPKAKVWAAAAEGQFFEAFKRLGADGAWHEGPCGWAFAMASFAPFWDAYGRKVPTQLDHSRWLQETWRFRLYSRNADGTFISFGDGRQDGHYQWTAWQAAPALRLLARKFANPYAQWLAGEEWNSRPNPYTAAWEIIWMDPTVEPKPPYSLPASTLFGNEGLAIMRTGWLAEDTAAALHCDSLVGQAAAAFAELDAEGNAQMNTAADHAHADANAVVVWSRGDFALRNAGYGQRDTEFQNSLLVDGKGQYRSFDRDKRPGTPQGVITSFFSSRFAAFARGEAARCYPAGLKEFSRAVYVVEPGVVFIVDRLSAEKEVLFEWLFHVHPDSSVVEGIASFKARRGKFETTLRLATPLVVTAALSKDRNNLCVRLTAPKPAKQMRFVAALLPSRPGDLAGEVDSPTENSLVVETPDAKVLAAFAAEGGELEVPGRLRGRGAVAIASAGPKRSGFLAVDATDVSVDGRVLITSPLAVTASCFSSGEKGELTISSGEPTQVAIDAGMGVSEVRGADGRAVPHLDDGPRIILHVPEGTSSYTLVPGERKAIEGN